MEVFTASGDVYVISEEKKEEILKRVRKGNEETERAYFDGSILVHEIAGNKETVDFDSVFDSISNHREYLQDEYGLEPLYKKTEIMSSDKVNLDKKR